MDSKNSILQTTMPDEQREFSDNLVVLFVLRQILLQRLIVASKTNLQQVTVPIKDQIVIYWIAFFSKKGQKINSKR